MWSGSLFICILSMNSLVNSQFGYGYRNWFGRASIFDSTCKPDGSPCKRMTECCSTSCLYVSDGPVCEPSDCGCPQPPWSNQPIDRECTNYNRPCDKDYHCCSLFCRKENYKCDMPPCKPCQ